MPTTRSAPSAMRRCSRAAAALALAAVAATTGAPAASAGSALPGGQLATERIAGDDRVTTSTSVAQDRFPAGAPAAVLARSDDFADALAGTALAHQVGGPLLLTSGGQLDARVAAELTATLRPGSTVWLLGSTSALGADVADAAELLGFVVARVAGADRYGTAAAVAAQVTSGAPSACDVVLATGRGFADGVAAGGLLTADRPLLFTDGESLPPATAAALAGCGPAGGSVTAVGGPAARALGGAALPGGLRVETVAGGDRYETSARLLTGLRSAPSGGGAAPVVLASGQDFADALVGGTYGHPVVLTAREGLPASVADALRAVSPTVAGVVVVGGEASVSAPTARAAAAAAAGQPAPASGDEGWEAAWRTGDHEQLRAWFAEQSFGPDVVTGTHPGGKVTTQAQADAMRDKRVTGNVVVDGDVTIRDVFFDGGRVDVAGGRVTFTDVLHDARGGTAHPNYLRVAERPGRQARVHFERVEVRNGQDGIQTAATEVTGRYVYIHGVARSTGALTGNDRHQDGWQHMKGGLALERSFIDYTGARTSAVMLKPDHGDISAVSINRTVIQGGGSTLLHIHDAGERRIGRIDLSDDLVAGARGEVLASVWEVNAGVVGQLRATTVRVSPGGQSLPVVDAAKLP